MWTVWNKADGSLAGVTRYLPAPPCDPTTQCLLELPDLPDDHSLVDGKLTRWDGGTGTRPATSQEQAAWVAAHLNG